MFNLTDSQERAVRSFEDFLGGPEQVFILKGAAGTGKTTLVKVFLEMLEREGREYDLMASTGRAAFILGSKTGAVARTIHRTIYHFNNIKSNNLTQEEEENGSMHVNFSLKNTLGENLNKIYIVDEASMVSDNFTENEAFTFGSGRLMTDLFQFIGGHKVIFVGDYAQLPPVGMPFSPALDKEYIEDNFSAKVKEVFLKDIVRQENDNYILENATKIRDSIESKTFIEFSIQEGPETKVVDQNFLGQYFSLSENTPPLNGVVISYSNQQVLDYNNLIRSHYFGSDAERIVPGELLLIARNNYNQEVELFNGNIVKVVSTQPDCEVEEKIVRIKLGKDKYADVPLSFRKVTIKFKAEGAAQEISVRILDNFVSDPSGKVTGLTARALVVDFENRLPKEIKENLRKIKNELRGKKTNDPNIEYLTVQYKNLLLSDPYYNAVICKYGYAMTCHKAQGGEWPNVLVDLFRYGNNANEDYFRWAYTAVTRASRMLWCYRSPEFDYISRLIVEDIQQSGNIKVSTYSSEKDFCATRFGTIKTLAANRGLNVSEDRSKPYQHLIEFSDDTGATVKFQLWFKDKGYSGKDVLITSSNEELLTISRGIIEESFIPLNIPFSAPERPFAQKLVEYVKAILEELDIRLLDIVKENYQDVFHLKTEGLAKAIFSYRAQGNYTHLKLISSLGKEDSKLIEFRNRFK